MFFEQAYRRWRFKYRLLNRAIAVGIMQDLMEKKMEHAVLKENGRFMLYSMDSLELHIFRGNNIHGVAPLTLDKGAA